MKLLLMDTCGMEGSVALAEGGAVVSSESLPGRSASERLVPVVREMMKAAGWRLRELAGIVVVHGPGSFTGVRVGVSAAKGLSEAGGVGVIAVSRLAVLAAAAGEAAGQVCAVMDAGRGEFYCGVYVGRRCVREALLSGEAVAAAVADASAVVVCEARVAEALSALKPRLVAEPVAGDALQFAVERIAAKQFDDVATLDANYLRRTDAEIFAKPAVSGK
ncbi:tRNA (adenosine(37)-N6)-threonylcarbamoyltransferase complex dimerization subunit type 1 TsaB [Edaphobacter aggregans]|uniref:tRNA (adenosine(37)-N6)-threonylcarbamoyltransferase complex dimerization subunit type 1 TsaB n=1 Tax=Edaphobacter aggregans TaxID=570835 RepID=UPI00068D590A|nr:tRNA (adenosine(37)-N6)-threonylcarbamoyltransferase complex dimerization subunit type 1 TsaB [Edaphobacter aggregans]